MCGTGSVGTTPTISTNATPLAGGGAATPTTSVAGALGSGAAVPAAPPVVGGGAGGGVDAAALSPLLDQLTKAVEALRQAVAGGALIGGGPAVPPPSDCPMMQVPPTPIQTPDQVPPSPEQAPPVPEQAPPAPKDKAKPKDKPRDVPPPPPAPPAPRPDQTDGGGGANAAPEAPAAPASPAAPTQQALIDAYKAKYQVWQDLYDQRVALRGEITRLEKQRDSYTAGGPDAIARNKVSEKIRELEGEYDAGFAEINRALIARNDAFRAAGLPRAIPPDQL
jgi:hypothetical protein